MFPNLRKTLLGGSLACTAVLLASLAQAADKPEFTAGPDPKGKWKKYEVGQNARFVIWHDDKGWNVRTTTAKDRKQFRGVITVDGDTFTSFSNYKTLDVKDKNKVPDFLTLNPLRQQLVINLSTMAHEDGFTFEVGPRARFLYFTLTVDGQEAPDKIFIGKNGDHPLRARFALPANP